MKYSSLLCFLLFAIFNVVSKTKERNHSCTLAKYYKQWHNTVMNLRSSIDVSSPDCEGNYPIGSVLLDSDPTMTRGLKKHIVQCLISCAGVKVHPEERAIMHQMGLGYLLQH